MNKKMGQFTFVLQLLLITFGFVFTESTNQIVLTDELEEMPWNCTDFLDTNVVQQVHPGLAEHLCLSVQTFPLNKWSVVPQDRPEYNANIFYRERNGKVYGFAFDLTGSLRYDVPNPYPAKEIIRNKKITIYSNYTYIIGFWTIGYKNPFRFKANLASWNCDFIISGNRQWEEREYHSYSFTPSSDFPESQFIIETDQRDKQLPDGGGIFFGLEVRQCGGDFYVKNNNGNHTCEQCSTVRNCNTSAPICFDTIVNELQCKNCKDGYKLENNVCIDINECENSPCGDYGNCSNLINKYECVCNDRWAGEHCQYCDVGYDGDGCDQCADKFYDNDSSVSELNCIACDSCDPNGKVNDICDKVTGNCQCKIGYTGRKCDDCSIGYYNDSNDISLTTNCEQCSNVTYCNISTAVCFDEIDNEMTCNKCNNGYELVNNKCVPCSGNNKYGNGITCLVCDQTTNNCAANQTESHCVNNLENELKCGICSAGFVIDVNGKCKDCPKGFVCPQGLAVPCEKPNNIFCVVGTACLHNNPTLSNDTLECLNCNEGFKVIDRVLIRKTGSDYKYLQNCTSLDLSDQGISSIDKNCFENMPKLMALDLQKNNILSLSPDAFDGAPLLILNDGLLLDMQTKCTGYGFTITNSTLYEREEKQFEYIANCTTLNFTSLELHGLGFDIFKYSNLEILDLSINKLITINVHNQKRKRRAKSQFDLKQLYLNNNLISNLVESGIMLIENKLNVLEIRNNNMDCCEMEVGVGGIDLLFEQHTQVVVDCNYNTTNNNIANSSNSVNTTSNTVVVVNNSFDSFNTFLDDYRAVCVNAYPIENKNDGFNNVIAIVAGVISSVLVAVVGTIVIIYIMKKKKKKKDLLYGKSVMEFVMNTESSNNNDSNNNNNNNMEYYEASSKDIGENSIDNNVSYFNMGGVRIDNLDANTNVNKTVDYEYCVADTYANGGVIELNEYETPSDENVEYYNC